MINKKTIPLITIVSVLLVSVLTTTAVLATVTGKQNNVFTFSQNLHGKLSEPNWADNAKQLTPGSTVWKDPMITNTSEIPTYTAIKMSFKYNKSGAAMSESDLTRLMNLITISLSSDWTLIEGDMIKDSSGSFTKVSPILIFVYNDVLGPGQVATPVFSAVHIKTTDEASNPTDKLTEDDLRWLQAIKIVNGQIVPDPGGLKGFYIDLTGALVQAEGDYSQVHQEALINLLKL